MKISLLDIHIWWVALLLMLPLAAFAQSQQPTAYTWEQFVDDYTDYAAEQEEEADNSVERWDWLEELEEVHRSPIDINRAERSELELLHFLSDEKIDSLLAKRDRYSGGFRSVGELMTVRQLTYRDRAWLSLLLKFEPLPYVPNSDAGNGSTSGGKRREDKSNRWYGGTHDVMGTLDVPLYERAGFGECEPEDFYAKKFTGQRVAHTLRYRYSWHQRVMYGATVQQDVGERWGCYGARPWDYGSAYFYYKSDAERYVQQGLRHSNRTESVNRYEVAVGDYKVALGQGLVVGGSGWNQRESMMGGFRKETVRIRPNTGTDESRFMRGAAANFRLGRVGQWQLTTFASWRQLDGTVKGMTKANNYDPLASDTITAWKTDGLHRTLQETNKRHTATQTLMGGRAGYRNAWLNVGMNAAWVHYDKVYWPAARAYNKYYMRGQDAAALSADYTVQLSRWKLQGEVAVDRRGALASTAALRWTPKRSLTLVLQERSMAKDFVTPYGRTMQTNSQMQNEHGAMVGFEWHGAQRLTLEGYVDGALHLHPVYLADTLSRRYEAMLQCVVRGDRQWTHTLRYKLRGREQNVTGYKDIPDLEGVLLSWRTTQHVRWQSAWKGRTTQVALGADGACYFSQGSGYDKKTNAITGDGCSFGVLAFVRATGRIAKRWKWASMLTGFSTEDYNSRVYAYAPQLAGSVSMPQYYGDGVAAAAVLEGQLWRGLHAAVRYGVVKYFDRDSIGSGVNLISGSSKNDLSLQLRYRF